MKTVFVTGAAGFIGFHLVQRLLQDDFLIVGFDNLNAYYDVELKYNRLQKLGIDRPSESQQIIKSTLYSNFMFVKADLLDKEYIESLFSTYKFDYVINLGAQAGVRHSLTHPQVYIDSNVTGFLHILEACRKYKPAHLLYASTSSVYGINKEIPFSAHLPADHPASLYAVSKKTNELMAHSYSHLYGIPSTGLRFFTVYGPWGRPDMALFLFTKAILANEPIQVFNHGNMLRDFTYVEDIIEAITRIMLKPAAPVPENEMNFNNPSISTAPYRIYNIGNSSPIRLLEYIEAIEHFLGKKANKEYLPMQPGDVVATFANTEPLVTDFGFKPQISIKEGISNFIIWYRRYYRV